MQYNIFYLHLILIDGVIFQVPNAPKRLRRDDTSTTSSDDAIVPEFDPQAEDTENKFANGKCLEKKVDL